MGTLITEKEFRGYQEAIMFRCLRGLITGISLLVTITAAYGQEVSREQIKGLDEQVQEIKGDVLSIAAELSQLEETLLYPSNTQVSVFVSLAGEEAFRLDSVEIRIDGQPVAHHLYTFKELEALQKGGVQRIYTGNIRSGEHDLKVRVLGRTGDGADIRRSEQFKVRKGVGPGIVEISVGAANITFKDR
jgi:predicted dinucleotide-utilizing enzyme